MNDRKISQRHTDDTEVCASVEIVSWSPREQAMHSIHTPPATVNQQVCEEQSGAAATKHRPKLLRLVSKSTRVTQTQPWIGVIVPARLGGIVPSHHAWI